MQCVLRKYDVTSCIFGELLWKNLTKYKELKKNTTVVVLTKKRLNLV